MIKEAIEKILLLGKPNTIEQNGITYTDKAMHELKQREKEHPEKIVVNTLTGLLDYIANKPDYSKEYVIHISSSKKVKLYGEYIERTNQRYKYLVAQSNQFDFAFGRYYEQEDFIINLLTQFHESDDRQKVFDIASKVTDESVAQYSDDGMSQKIQLKQGVGIENKKIPNPVILCPKDTFSEISSIESPYVLRIRKSGSGLLFALFDADSGVRESVTICAIRKYIEKELNEVLEKNNVEAFTFKITILA